MDARSKVKALLNHADRAYVALIALIVIVGLAARAVGILPLQ